MKVCTLVVGMLQVNCYLAWDEASLNGFIIDPGDEAETILAAVTAEGLLVQAVLLTHGHVDHIRGVTAVAAQLGVPVVLGLGDKPLYFSPKNMIAGWVPAAQDLPEPVDALLAVPTTLPGLALQVLPTPGHSQGGVCYYFPAAGVLFSGDTLFRGSIGRTDLPGGDHGQLLRSIREQLLTLPPATQVYPGHGEPTCIEAEISNNPYLQARA